MNLFRREDGRIVAEKKLYLHIKHSFYVPYCCYFACGPLRRFVRSPFVAAADLRRSPDAGFPSGHRAFESLRRREARLPALALLGPLRLRRHAVHPRSRYGADGRGLCPLDRAYLRPSDRRRADGFAHAPRFGFASHARLLHDAGRAGYPRPQFAAAQRRILYSRSPGGAGESLLRRVRTYRTFLRPRYGDAEPHRRAGQRFPLYARFGRHRNALWREGRIRAAVHQQPPAARCANSCASRSAVRRCSP